jgi:hypothetical protein
LSKYTLETCEARDTVAVAVRWDDVEAFAAGLDGVHFGSRDGLRVWRLRGRLIARELDSQSLVIRSAFDVRSALLRQFPDTFSVPAQFEKHMMVVVDLPRAEPAAVEQALDSAWQLQSLP